MENSLPAYYRTNDPVDNLLVKITLRKKNARDPAGELAMQSQATLGFTRTARSADAPLTSTGVFDVRDKNLESSNSFEFAWQQKVYGPRELLRCAAAIAQKREGEPVTSVNTSSPAEMEHFRDVERRLDAGEPLFEVGPSGTLLYTMTDRDGYIPPSELNRELLSGSTPLSALPVLPPTLAGPLQEQWARLMQGTSYSGAGAQGIGAAVAQPLSDARGVFARAYKENPYRVMYICAAVGIDRDAFRARRLDTALHEVPLLAIRAYTPDAGGTITGGGTSLIEMRPGFTDYIPYDRASVVALTRTISGEAPVSGMAAALALAAADTVLGQGHYGGQIKLRPLSSVERGAQLTADGSAMGVGGATPGRGGREGMSAESTAALEQEGTVLAYALECHSFTCPLDGSSYEFSVSNPDEDLSSTLAKVTAQGTAGSGAVGSRWGRRKRAVTGDSEDDEEALLGLNRHDMVGDRDMLRDKAADRDALVSIRAEEMRAIERASNRVPTAWHSALPQGMHTGSFRMTCYLDIVAAAKFSAGNGLLGTGSSSLSGLLLPLLGLAPSAHGVYIVYELVVPKGSGWKLLPDSDLPHGGGGGVDSGGRVSLYTAADMTSGRGGGVGLGGGLGMSLAVPGGSPMRAAGADIYEYGSDGSEEWDYDAEGEREGGEGGQEESTQPQAEDAAEGAARAGQGLRNRATDRAPASRGDGPAAPAPRPPRRVPKRWLRGTHVRGITQVAGFRTRPWMFGREGASKPTGVFSARAGVCSPPGGGDGGMGGSREHGPGTVTGAGGALAPQRHPFGFTGAADVAAPGYQRIDGKYTSRTTLRGPSRGDGSGSVSLLTSLAKGEGDGTGWEAFAVQESDQVPVAHIGHPITVHLQCDASTVSSPSGPSPPQLFLTVYSRDGWDRHCVEGYAWMQLPMTAGSQDSVLTAWKPIPVDREQAEAAFYLGGSTRLSDPSYARIPSTWGDHAQAQHAAAARASAAYDRATSKARKTFASLVSAATGVGTAELAARAQAAAGIQAAQAVVEGEGAVKGAPVASLNRLGFTTVTAGEIGVRCHTLVQRYPPAERGEAEESSARTGAGGRRGGNSILTGSAGGSVMAATQVAMTGRQVGTAKTVEQIIAEAQAIRKRDRERREAAASGRVVLQESKAGEGKDGEEESPSKGLVRSPGSHADGAGAGPGAITSPGYPSPQDGVKEWAATGKSRR